MAASRRALRAGAALLGTAGLLLGASCIDLLGIGDPKTEDPTPATSGAGGHPATTATTTVATTSTTGGAGGMAPKCEPTDPSCHIGNSACLGLVDNRGLTDFALRVAQINFFKPASFTGTFEKAAFASAVTMPLPACYLMGSGTFSWLIAVDTAKSEYTVGASKPPMNPRQGYSFVNETVMLNGQAFPLAPATGHATIDAQGNLTAETLEYIDFPVYLDAAAMDVILIPLHKVSLVMGVLSADHNCIGSFNAAGLSPSNGCLPDVTQDLYAFTNGAKLQGYITLEEADKVVLTSFGLDRSLCVLLTGAASVFGDGGSPAHCKRDGKGEIKFPGDWCAATNTAASPSCYNAMQFDAGVAASAVKRN